MAYDGLRMAIYAIIRYKWHICDNYTAAGDGRWAASTSKRSCSCAATLLSRHPRACLKPTHAAAYPLAPPPMPPMPPLPGRSHVIYVSTRHVIRNIHASTSVCEEQRRPRGPGRLEGAWACAASAEHAQYARYTRLATYREAIIWYIEG